MSATTHYVGQLVAQRTGLSRQDAEKRVTDTYMRLQTALNNAEAQAKDAATSVVKHPPTPPCGCLFRCSSVHSLRVWPQRLAAAANLTRLPKLRTRCARSFSCSLVCR